MPSERGSTKQPKVTESVGGRWARGQLGESLMVGSFKGIEVLDLA
jgi:hypothetical protein